MTEADSKRVSLQRIADQLAWKNRFDFWCKTGTWPDDGQPSVRSGGTPPFPPPEDP